MTVGDVVNGVFASGINYIQPAVGVELCITSAVVWQDYIMMTDGVTVAYLGRSTSITQDTYSSNMQVKLMLTNTNYLQLSQGGANVCSYSGVQIK